MVSSQSYFRPPYYYINSCFAYCLECWLLFDFETPNVDGNLLREFGTTLGPDSHLVIMPIARSTLDFPMRFPGRAIFYPPGQADLASLNVVPNDANKLTAHQAAASGVDLQTIDNHTIVVFTKRFDWDSCFEASHNVQMEFIRMLSETVDDLCLNMIRYRLCRLDFVDSLPGRAGQLDSNHMMAGALVYDAGRHRGHIVGGAAFSHVITKGLGLPIEPLDTGDFPTDGEVGRLARHSLLLYAELLEANTPTSKFIQALALLDFLADPNKFSKFQDAKRVIARYVARDAEEYRYLLDRFSELTGKKNHITGEEKGFRTRIIHMGTRLNELIPSYDGRQALFRELDRYIRAMIDHLIMHSQFSFTEYQAVRNKMRPFEYPSN